MVDITEASSPSMKPVYRSSVACAACRYKHHRCDGQKPACSRCIASVRECIYPLSRRRGKQRQRQARLASPVMDSESSIRPALQAAPNATDTVSTCCNENINPILLDLYYEFFHAAHPCTIPRVYLDKHLTEDALRLLASVICYIGSLFSESVSDELQKNVEVALMEIRTGSRTVTGFDVQAMLLYSIAVYWCNEAEHGTALLDEAIQLGLGLGMNRKEFAVLHGQNSPVLEESWRRTWWLFYVTDAHIAGSTHTFPFRTSNIDITVDLPCEEQEYHSGNIPPAKSIEDYDNREFFADDELLFSSYAELIGLTRGIEHALLPGSTADAQLYKSMCANADTSVRAWHALLPTSKRRLICSDGSVDEVMFKALFIMHTYTVEIHRPLSTLAYSPIEAVSRCAPLAPSEHLQCSDKAASELHTVKCLSAIENLDHLLTLPTNLNAHSPFLICMIANVTIAHLSACRYILQGKKLVTSREKIRLTMGTLKRLSEHWILGKRTYREIGIIAREILSLTARSATVPANTNFPQPDEPLMNFDSSEVPFGLNFDFCAPSDDQFSDLMETIQASS